jgi:FKBP-type peptidyl-prolyl cis-trans isomerase SlyD
MRVADKSAVTLSYALHLGDGVIVEKSEPEEPLSYLHGFGQIVPGLEKALEGLSAGESKRVVVPPEEGYGVRDETRIQVVPQAAFEGETVAVGDEFTAIGPDGMPTPMKIVAVAGDRVTIDLNHPLAGATLHFSIDILGVREATEEELEHGHVHGEDDHEHGHDHDAHP